MKTIPFVRLVAARVATASLALPAAGADDPGATAALLQRVADGGEGAMGDKKPAVVLVAALPPDWNAPVPSDAKIVGSIVREASGTTIYLDVPHRAAETAAALEASLVSAGYTAKELPGQGGFSTAGFTPPRFFCGNHATVTVQAYADAGSPGLTHVNLSRTAGNATNLICGGGDTFLAQASAIFASTIPNLHGTDAITIDTSTTGLAAGAGAVFGNGPRPSSAWGHLTSGLPLAAVERAIAAQLTAGGWVSADPVALAPATAAHRFTTPATDKAPAGNALLLVVAGPGGTYDAFVRSITPRKP
jgi:hypothetical protein